MNKRSLKRKLNALHIPEHLYNLDGKGRTDERFCIENIEGRWHVYYSERGNKTTHEIFDSEQDACAYIYKQFTDE